MMTLKSSYIILIGIVVNIFIGCNQSDPNVAGVKHFYFEITDSIDNDYSRELIANISEMLPAYDYLMSEQSAEKGWPFYGTVERGSKVYKTDMMPPHAKVNRLSPINKLPKENASHEHIMRLDITIETRSPEKIKVSKKTFALHDGQWESFSMRIESEFDTSVSVQELSEKIAKTLTRYTFK